MTTKTFRTAATWWIALGGAHGWSCALAAESPEALYRKMAGEGSEAAIRKILEARQFDLRSPEVSELLLGKMNQIRKRGDHPAQAMRKILEQEPEGGFDWLLTNYQRLVPAGRENLIMAVVAVDCKETYELAELMLEDRSIIEDRDARWPPGRHWHMRVCDVTYGMLMNLLHRKNVPTPEGLHHMFGTTQEIGDRDERLQRFSLWWSERKSEIVAVKPALSAKAPALRAKLDAIKAKKGE